MLSSTNNLTKNQFNLFHRKYYIEGGEIEEGDENEDESEEVNPMYSTERTARQLVPTHYYGPPSAGWGGFHPGHTGGGWGAPYWYK